MVAVGVPDFSLVSVPDTATVFRQAPFITASDILNLASINNFAATISITATISFVFVSTPGSASLPFTLGPTVTLAAGGTATDALIATITRSTAGTGEYVATITAVGGGKTHTLTFSIWVIDFTVTPRDTTITMINQVGTLGQDPLSVAAIGAPNTIGPPPNATDGFNINPGLTEGVAAFPLDPGYNTGNHGATASNGIKISSALGLDVSNTARRCFLEVFDSTGHLIEPTYNSKGTTVLGFAGPLVHLNGDQFGFPAAANGCRFDSFWYVDPLNGNTLGAATDTNLVTVEPLTTTPNGTFTALVCLQAGGDINCVNITIIMVAPPPSPPAFTQFLWQGHKISLSRTTTLTLKGGLNTTITDPTLDAFVQVTAVSSDGNFVVVGTSSLVTLGPGTNTNNIVITLDFSGTTGGETYSISAIAFYGIHGVTVGSPSGTVYATGQSTNTIGTSSKIIGSLTVTS